MIGMMWGFLNAPALAQPSLPEDCSVSIPWEQLPAPKPASEVARKLTLSKAFCETVKALPGLEASTQARAMLPKPPEDSAEQPTQSPPILYHRYLRPASRRELKEQRAAGTHQYLLPDSGIYVRNRLHEPQAFFVVDKPSEASVRLAPQPIPEGLLLPPNLKAVGWDTLPDSLLLLSQTDAYWLLEVDKVMWVYYPQVMAPAAVFAPATQQTDRLPPLLASLQGLRLQTGDLPLDQLPVVASAQLEGQQLRLALRDPTGQAAQPAQWWLKPSSKASLYKPECLERFLAERAAYQAREEERQATYLRRLAQGDLPIETLEGEARLLEGLLAQFEISEDALTGIKWYLHKAQTPEKLLDRSLVKVNFNDRGSAYLQSVLHAPQPLNHSQVRLLHGQDTLWTSRNLPTYDQRNFQLSLDEGEVQEQIHFTGEDVFALMQQLARLEEGSLKCQFLAKGKVVQEVALDQRQVQALQETYVLHRYLKAKASDK